MGGPQSPRDAKNLPYLQEEINFLRSSIKADRYVLGFCLGAQLISEALGGKTLKSPQKEVDIFPVQLTYEGIQNRLFQDFSAHFLVIHWHNDMPPWTEGATLLATSEGCPAQAYQYRIVSMGYSFIWKLPEKVLKNCFEMFLKIYLSAPIRKRKNNF